MPLANANNIELFFETFGDPSDETVLLIMGFTAQMTTWPQEMIEDLVERGFHVVIFDNRDCGLSTKSNGPSPNVAEVLGRVASGEALNAAEVPYTLSDMALDALGVLDHLGIKKATVAGASMGGMIVQTLAIEHPARLQSAVSIMSTTGARGVGESTPEAMAALLAPPPKDRDAVLAQNLETNRIISGPLWDRDRALKRTEASYDRSFHPQGAAFQLAAVFASGDRTEALADVAVPFLVIHGMNDDLIGVSGGHATQKAVPGADLLVLDAMGHDLPPALLAQINSAIEAGARRPTLGLAN